MTEPRLQDAPAVYVSATAFDQRRVGAAAVYCSDGRYGEQMDEFLHRCLGLPRYDRVAMPGGAASLAGHGSALCEQMALERQLEFLIKDHALTRVVLIAHEGCGFYKNLWTGQSPEQQQAADLRTAAERIRQWNSTLQVEAYFARKVEGRVTFESWGKWPETPAKAPSVPSHEPTHRNGSANAPAPSPAAPHLPPNLPPASGIAPRKRPAVPTH